MKRISIIALALALSATACSKNANNTNTSNANNKTSTSTSTSNSPGTSSTSSSTDSSSPSAAYKAAYEAAKIKDTTTLKGLLSQASLNSLNEAAKSAGKTSDELLKASIDDPEDPLPATFEIRNEQVNGDRASLEYKNSKGEWEKVNLVKEGGSWKLDLTEGGKSSGPESSQGGDEGEGHADDHSGH